MQWASLRGGAQAEYALTGEGEPLLLVIAADSAMPLRGGRGAGVGRALPMIAYEHRRVRAPPGPPVAAGRWRPAQSSVPASSRPLGANWDRTTAAIREALAKPLRPSKAAGGWPGHCDQR